VCQAWHVASEVKVLTPGEFILSEVEGRSLRLGVRQRLIKRQAPSHEAMAAQEGVLVPVANATAGLREAWWPGPYGQAMVS